VAGLLPSAPRAGRVDRQWQAPAPSSNGAMGVRTQGQMGSADPPPWKTDEKLKSENMQKKQFSMMMLYFESNQGRHV